MTSGKAVVLIIASLIPGSPAMAQGSTSGQAEISGPPVSAPGEDRLVCKYVLKTGTRFKQRSCSTLKDWEAMREKNRRAAQEFIDTPKTCAPTQASDRAPC